MSIATNDIIVLRSVFGKVGQKYFIQPVKDPKTGRYPDFVKRVNSQGDMILTDQERNSREYFIPETEVFVIEDGKTFNLNDEVERKQWEAIKNCSYIAPSRYAKDSKGDSLIDGTLGWKNPNPRYGQAELYVYKPEAETNRRLQKRDLFRKALNFIYEDEKGNAGRVLIARLLGKNMNGVSDGEVTDFLVSIAETDPNKIINLYTGSDTTLRLLFIEAKDKHVIYVKSKLYMYAENIVLGATDDAVITWMKDPKNHKLLELIKRDTYPEMYQSEEPEKPSKSSK
jgi:hypothetical protein